MGYRDDRAEAWVYKSSRSQRIKEGFILRVAMRGKFALNSASIDAQVPATPGAYVLVNSNNNAVYVGRSDSDLNARLKNHLPECEENAWIRRSFPTDFYFDATSSSQEAYRLECDWFHKYRPNCNSAHPAKLSNSWACPVCGL